MTRTVSARVSCESGPRMVFRDVRVVCVALLRRRVASRLRGVGWLLLVGIIARHGECGWIGFVWLLANVQCLLWVAVKRQQNAKMGGQLRTYIRSTRYGLLCTHTD